MKSEGEGGTTAERVEMDIFPLQLLCAVIPLVFGLCSFADYFL